MLRVEQLFGLALRIIGVVLVYYGLYSLLDAALFSLGYFSYAGYSVNYYLVSGLFLTVFGIYLVRGAATVVAFAYPSGDDRENDGQDTDESEPSIEEKV
jgi:hypothetical protein